MPIQINHASYFNYSMFETDCLT